VAKPSTQVGRQALSLVDTIASDGKISLVRVRIETGRTHRKWHVCNCMASAAVALISLAHFPEIRVHLQDNHTPVYGDEVYGLSDWNARLKKAHGIERPLLHAYRLEIDHPITQQKMRFEAPLVCLLILFAAQNLARTISLTLSRLAKSRRTWPRWSVRLTPLCSNRGLIFSIATPARDRSTRQESLGI
jgi:hypothetical protein